MNQTTQLDEANSSRADPNIIVVKLSAQQILATHPFVCDICQKGFQRDQNLQLHRRSHNIPWKLEQRNPRENRRKVYTCPVQSCVHHNPEKALGDITGVKKHFARKHCEKNWICRKCRTAYALESDLNGHVKKCGTRDHRCDCGTSFTRRERLVAHRVHCEDRLRLSDASANHQAPLLPPAQPHQTTQPSHVTPHQQFPIQQNLFPPNPDTIWEQSTENSNPIWDPSTETRNLMWSPLAETQNLMWDLPTETRNLMWSPLAETQNLMWDLPTETRNLAWSPLAETQNLMWDPPTETCDLMWDPPTPNFDTLCHPAATNTIPTLIETRIPSYYKVPPPPHVPMSATMSATALLQKAISVGSYSMGHVGSSMAGSEMATHFIRGLINKDETMSRDFHGLATQDSGGVPDFNKGLDEILMYGSTNDPAWSMPK